MEDEFDLWWAALDVEFKNMDNTLKVVAKATWEASEKNTRERMWRAMVDISNEMDEEALAVNVLRYSG